MDWDDDHRLSTVVKEFGGKPVLNRVRQLGWKISNDGRFTIMVVDRLN